MLNVLNSYLSSEDRAVTLDDLSRMAFTVHVHGEYQDPRGTRFKQRLVSMDSLDLVSAIQLAVKTSREHPDGSVITKLVRNQTLEVVERSPVPVPTPQWDTWLTVVTIRSGHIDGGLVTEFTETFSGMPMNDKIIQHIRFALSLTEKKFSTVIYIRSAKSDEIDADDEEDEET